MAISVLGENDNRVDIDAFDDDFVMLDEPLNFAVRPKKAQPQNTSSLSIEINPYQSSDSFLVSIHPPDKPLESINHVPCDIVLVIDVSGSMASLAPLPDARDDEERESSGLTVLDLVRHACRTIISTLNKNDRLALITFSDDADVIQDLTCMTEMAKSKVLDRIDKLKDQGATNLWAGIKTGLHQFEKHSPVGNVQGLYILTDGQPNYMCPQQGYIPKLKPLLKNLYSANQSAPTIQTFGFGYSIRSDLMLSIAKAGNGNYAFIPEVGMIGTVFVHAVANLFATYATNATLALKIPGFDVNEWSHCSGLPVDHVGGDSLFIKLGNIQYGQSRDLVISCPLRRPKSKISVSALLTYTRVCSQENATATSSLARPSNLSPDVLIYHLYRHDLCSFFSSLYPIDNDKDQHITTHMSNISTILRDLEFVVKNIYSDANHASDLNKSSLLKDLIGQQLNPKTPEHGQIYQALQTNPENKGSRIFKSYWQKWGRHYLSSLWCAHMRQTCNSFKDAGPLRYGINSELFQKCRDELDAAFDNLPPPKSTYVGTQHANSVGIHGARGTGTPLRMNRYNNADYTCFLGSCAVTLHNGSKVKVQDLRVGMTTHNPLTAEGRTVKAIVKSSTDGHAQKICLVGAGLWITPWHPIIDNGTGTWIFPQAIAVETRTLGPDESVYSILLEPSTDANAHAVEVNDISCVTLGHGLISVVSDVRSHPFFGSYEAVVESLAGLSVDEHGRQVCGGLMRDSVTGLACGMLGVDNSRVLARL